MNLLTYLACISRKNSKIILLTFSHTIHDSKLYEKKRDAHAVKNTSIQTFITF